LTTLVLVDATSQQSPAPLACRNSGRPSQRVGQKLEDDRADNRLTPLQQHAAQLRGTIETAAVGQRSGRIDGQPSSLAATGRWRRSFRARSPVGPSRCASGTDRVLAMLLHPHPHRRGMFGVAVLQRRHVRRRGGGETRASFEQPLAAHDWRGARGERGDAEDAALPQQPAPRLVRQPDTPELRAGDLPMP